MRRTFSFLLNLAVYVGIIAGVLFGMPRFLLWYLHTPYPMAAITSGSMWPVLHTGDLAFIEGVGKGDLRVGDIVVWKNSQGFTIHRVVRLEEDRLVTKGDANFTEDDPVKYEDVIGRLHQVWGRNARIPQLGLITMYASQR